MNIGISQRIDRIASHDEMRDSLDQRMVNWVISMGFTPILIPNSLVSDSSPIEKQFLIKEWIHSMSLKAIILSGGNNIGEMIQRDLTEQYLLKWAEDNYIPVLGICRGMQMMGVYYNAELEDVEGHVRVRHQLRFDVKKEKFPESVNSFHDQSLVSCPSQFKVLATSEDGRLEAMAHTELPWEGWMWHPEREPIFSPVNEIRFKSLIMDKR
jgi:N5-(cytidine 5'-diphosphoramidyl)-L-glutamine hydrolase